MTTTTTTTSIRGRRSKWVDERVDSVGKEPLIQRRKEWLLGGIRFGTQVLLGVCVVVGDAIVVGGATTTVIKATQQRSSKNNILQLIIDCAHITTS